MQRDVRRRENSVCPVSERGLRVLAHDLRSMAIAIEDGILIAFCGRFFWHKDDPYVRDSLVVKPVARDNFSYGWDLKTWGATDAED